NLEEEISGEKYAEAGAEGAFAEFELALHLQLREADIDSVEVADDVKQEHERQEPPKQFADRLVAQLHIGCDGHIFCRNRIRDCGSFSWAIISKTIASGLLSTVTMIASSGSARSANCPARMDSEAKWPV